VRAADRVTGRQGRHGERLVPAGLALLLAAVLLADGALVLSRSMPAPPPPAAAARPAALTPPPPPVAAPPPAPAAAPPPAPAAVPPPRPAPPVVPTSEPQQPGQLRLAVPALGVDTASVSLPVGEDGALGVPSTAREVGWYAAGAVPGDVGPAVFAGHVDLDGRPGVFSRLAGMRTGDVVQVVRPDGRPVSFVVTRVEQHAKDAFPTTAVYGPTDTPELRLITCGGSFDRTRGSYRDNVVVFGVLA